MPAREGNRPLNISLPVDLVAHLDAQAAALPGASRSSLILTALRTTQDAGASTSLVTGLHQRLDALAATVEALRQEVQDVRQAQQRLAEAVQTLLREGLPAGLSGAGDGLQTATLERLCDAVADLHRQTMQLMHERRPTRQPWYDRLLDWLDGFGKPRTW